MTILRPTHIAAVAFTVAALGFTSTAFAGVGEPALLHQFRAGQSSSFGDSAPMAIAHAMPAPVIRGEREAALLDQYQAGTNNHFGSGMERVHGLAAVAGQMPSRAALEAQFQIGKNNAFSNTVW